MSCYKLSFRGIADQISVPSSSDSFDLNTFFLDLQKAMKEGAVTKHFKPVTGSIKQTTTLTIVDKNEASKVAAEIGGINTLRIKGTSMHYGNPFSHTNYPGVVKIVPTVKEAVEAYRQWLTGENYQEIEPARRQWILDQINSGNLYGKPLVYYTENIPDDSYWVKKYDYVTAPNHAHILLQFINAQQSKQWSRISQNGYEVSSKGDQRFSAFNAHFQQGTILFDQDVSGLSIEHVYQEIVKKSRKGYSPSKESILNISKYNIFEDNIPKTVPQGLADKIYNLPSNLTEEDIQDFSYYVGYLPLWKEWAKQNPQLIQDLIVKSAGKTLTDQFADTRVSQARALADIINEQTALSKEDIIAKQSEVKGDLNTQEDYSTWKFYSGAAKGADTIWATEARKYGIDIEEYTPIHWDQLSQEEKTNYESIYQSIASELGRRPLDESTYAGKMVRKNLLQVKDSDQILAIGHIGTQRQDVEGDTGYAVQRGIQLGLPVFVYDLFFNTWKTYDYNRKKYITCDPPSLTSHSTLIGTNGKNDPEILNTIQAVVNEVFSRLKTSIKADLRESRISSSDLIDKINKYTLFATQTNRNYKPLRELDTQEAFKCLEIHLNNLGVTTHFVTQEQLSNYGLPANTEAAVVHGELVVNTSIASVSAPMHELMHMVFAVMKIDSFDTYLDVTTRLRALPEVQEMVLKLQQSEIYSGMLDSELVEEAFVRYLSDILEQKISPSEDFQIVYNQIEGQLMTYTERTFNVPKITNLIGFLSSPLYELTGYRSQLFMPKDNFSTNYSGQKYKVDVAGKISNYIQILFEHELLQKGDCE